ncbi:MAG: hypothetical protein JRN68_07925 [Nitrososphaerota archaeon]|nr:hypothetical protein [Nitrososphaerota archaeon]
MVDSHSWQFSMGTTTVLTNTTLKARKVFELPKHRVNVDHTLDTFRNSLHADSAYLRDETHIQGWMFANFVAMFLYCNICNLPVGKVDTQRVFACRHRDATVMDMQAAGREQMDAL